MLLDKETIKIRVCNAPLDDDQPRESASAIQSKDEEPVVTKITDVPICEPSVDCVLQNLSLRVHRVAGDGNCLFHAIAHQCGRKESTATAVELRHLCATVMEKYPHIQREDGLSDEQWIKLLNVAIALPVCTFQRAFILGICENTLIRSETNELSTGVVNLPPTRSRL